MKKTLLSIILTLVLVISLTVSPYAVSASEEDIHEHNEVTIIFNEDSIFTDEEKEVITNYFNSDNGELIEPHGIMCTLLGHDYKEEFITAINHKVYDVAPRCVEEYYDVQVCSRCSHTEAELTGAMRINCCP